MVREAKSAQSKRKAGRAQLRHKTGGLSSQSRQIAEGRHPSNEGKATASIGQTGFV
jgi:hypothetical protein